MNPWTCTKCKKQFNRNELTELFGWAIYVCDSCIELWIKQEQKTESSTIMEMEWISVKERLPKKENKHIVCLINEKPILCFVHDATLCLTEGKISFYYPQKEWIKDQYYGDVTHWMPLPKPPKPT